MANITIGSDPEFVIMCGDKIENALEIFTRLKEPDYCCECSYPSIEEINDIYYYDDTKLYIENAISHLTPYYLAPEYPYSKATAIQEFYDQYGYHLHEIYTKEIKQDFLIDSTEALKYIIDEYYTITYYYEQGVKFNDLDEVEQIDIIREGIEYDLDIQEWYDGLQTDDQRRYDDILRDEIIRYYEDTGYVPLNELPDNIRENIEEDIIDQYECSSCEVQEDYFCSTELGCDGQSILGEMRPKYGNNPLEHFNRILKLMKELNDMLSPEMICHGSDQLQVKAGTIQGDYQLGGHIHIGYAELYKNLSIISIFNIGNFLGIYVGIPLTLIEDTDKAIRRHKSYGSFGASRAGEDYYGIEFRMPSSWLVSPQITIGALSLAYVASYEYIKMMLSKEDFITRYNRNKKIEDYKILYNKALEEMLLYQLQQKIPEIYSEIQQMELYPEYKEYIDYIFDMVQKHKTWESDTNILPRWAELW